MKNVSPFGSVPVRIAGSSASGVVKSCAVAAAVHRISDSRYAALMRLKIRRLSPTIPLPSYATDEAAGFDLAAAHDLTIAPGGVALVRTGLIIEVGPVIFWEFSPEAARRSSAVCSLPTASAWWIPTIRAPRTKS